MSFTIPSISIEKLLSQPKIPILDVRSPTEFQLDHIPRATNTPLFNDRERAIIGTLYKRSSREEAIESALSFVEQNIWPILENIQKLAPTLGKRPDPALIQSIGDVVLQNRAPIQAIPISSDQLDGYIAVCCWRGGLRSKSLVALLNQLNVRAVCVENGYKAYRRHINTQLAKPEMFPQFICLHGLTGAGKTTLLNKIKEQHPQLILDLEKLAGHRSSVLGAVGLTPRNKKQFDSGLFQFLVNNTSPVLVAEWEARRIGSVPLPDKLYDKMQTGIHIEIHTSTEIRIERLVQEYGDNKEELLQAIGYFKYSLGKKQGEWLEECVKNKSFHKAGRALLEWHYDSRYIHAMKKFNFDYQIDATHLDRATKQIIDVLQNKLLQTASSGKS